MKKSIVKVLFSLTAALILSTTAFSEPCLRIYCKKDTKTKILNPAGHGRYFAAKEMAGNNLYLIAGDEFLKIRQECKIQADEFPATDADKLETFAPWVRVKAAPASGIVQQNPRCTSMEKK